MFRANVYRALLASPSQLSEERDAVEQAIHDWNLTHAAEMNMMVMPSRWETDVSPAFGRPPQAIINQTIVDPCDLLIGLFGETLGSPTQNAASGTVEEIVRVHEAGKPVMVYFGDRTTKASLIDPEQLSALRKFKASFGGSGMYGSFTDAADLARKVEKDLLRVMRSIRFPDDSAPPRLSTNYLVEGDLCTIRSQVKYYDYFATEEDGETSILHDPLVLLSVERISNMVRVIGVLEQIARLQRPLLIIAPSIEGEVLDTLATNKLRGTLACCPVDFSGDREAYLVLRKFTGATIAGELGIRAEHLTARELGRASKVIVERARTRLWRAVPASASAAP